MSIHLQHDFSDETWKLPVSNLLSPSWASSLCPDTWFSPTTSHKCQPSFENHVVLVSMSNFFFKQIYWLTNLLQFWFQQKWKLLTEIKEQIFSNWQKAELGNAELSLATFSILTYETDGMKIFCDQRLGRFIPSCLIPYTFLNDNMPIKEDHMTSSYTASHLYRL